MVSRFSFFRNVLQYSLLRFLPSTRQRFFDYLEEVTGNALTEICSEDILEIGVEQFGLDGLLLGSIALFLTSLMLMAAVDVILWRISNMLTAFFVNSLSGLYCLEKFRCNRKNKVLNLLIVFYIGTTIVSGFQWAITTIFLVLFTTGIVYAQKGGSSC